MGIHFVVGVKRSNGRIVGIKTEETDSLGSKFTTYWPAKSVYAVQDTMEYETIGREKFAKGFYDFSVRSRDGFRSVGIRAEKDGYECYIELPKMGDEDLLQNLPECE
jgi:hypothetical protein